MNDDTIQDLKQFIATTVSQQLTLTSEDIKAEMKIELQKLDKKIEDTSAGIAEAIDNLAAHVETRLDNHQERVTKLEEQPA